MNIKHKPEKPAAGPARDDSSIFRNLPRPLTPAEQQALIERGNSAEEWETLLFSDPFNPDLIRGNRFGKNVRIGAFHETRTEHKDRVFARGIYNCAISDSDIGDDTSVRNVGYCANYRIAEGCILSDIDELYCAAGSAKPEIHLMNESGGRGIPPLEGMTAADAYLWAKFREDTVLLSRLGEIAGQQMARSFGGRGIVGPGTVIRSCPSIRNVRFGPLCEVSGALSLEDLVIDSSQEEPTIIGPGAMLAGGAIGRGCRVLYGATALRFVMGEGSTIKYGARILDTFLGDNSTIACCEVVSSLIFPGHEQHHNTSFLIAALVMGQSNIAAGATIGSNHNSRGADNELVARRGFWPGLNVSLKHPSSFASFTLIAKGSYPAELKVPLPFSLVNTNEHQGRLEIMQGFWWTHNIYALAGYPDKYRRRDRRVSPAQQLEFDFLAPDTADEIAEAMGLMRTWAGGEYPGYVDVPPGVLERSRRPVRLLKFAEGYRAYEEMLLYYVVMSLLSAMEKHPGDYRDALARNFSTPEPRSLWINLGGQLVVHHELEKLRGDIREGTINSLAGIHGRYRAWGESYPIAKQRHAYGIFLDILEGADPSPGDWRRALKKTRDIQRDIYKRALAKREQDYSDPFSLVSYASSEERDAVRGPLSENSFLIELKKHTDTVCRRIDTILAHR